MINFLLKKCVPNGTINFNKKKLINSFNKLLTLSDYSMYTIYEKHFKNSFLSYSFNQVLMCIVVDLKKKKIYYKSKQ